jgi:hypothetical protein
MAAGPEPDDPRQPAGDAPRREADGRPTGPVSFRSLPRWVVHADWGTEARKQQVARAVCLGDGSFLASAPGPFGTGEPSDPLTRLGVPADDRAGGVLAGFDFPIGLPAAYARAVGIESFREALPALGSGEWSRFFDVAPVAGDIALRRPFYPLRSNDGPVAWADLEAALGMAKAELKRHCEASGGESLFWTLGGKQVGKAAISGWRSVLQPLLARFGSSLGLWPFDGDLESLLQRRAVVVAETYPALFYRRFGFRLIGAGKGSKRRQPDRRAEAPLLLSAASDRQVELTPALRSSIEHGFGPASGGEDAFDAVVGMLGMIDVLRRRAPSPEVPSDRAIRTVEGWMLGLAV